MISIREMHPLIVTLKTEKNITQVVYLTAAGFFAILSYPFTRTSAAPFFNVAYGASALPWAMIAAAILAMIVVIIYNELAKKAPLIPLCIGALIFIIAVNLVFGMVLGRHPRWVALLYYAWSDVYILIIVEQFWSISNTLFNQARARRYYGFFLAAGALGGLTGNLLVARLAEPIGSVNMIFLNCLALSVLAFIIAIVNTTIAKRKDLKYKFKIEHYIADRSFVGGASLVFKNKYLLFIALLIVSTQFYINSAYHLFNYNLSMATDVVDRQSALYGKTFFLVELLAITTSLIITPLALKYLGLKRTHYSIIALITVTFLTGVVFPHLSLLAALFVVAKGFDYSIFRAAKEMLYLPLHVAEKFQAKAFIDVFTYRFSKAFAAFGILLVFNILRAKTLFESGRIGVILIGFGILMWFVLIIFILKIYRDRYQGGVWQEKTINTQHLK